MYYTVANNMLIQFLVEFVSIMRIIIFNLIEFNYILEIFETK